jgi:hypothetical protein
LQALRPFGKGQANYLLSTGARYGPAIRRKKMKKLLIAAVAATLVGSTSLALANDSGRKIYDTANDFWSQEYNRGHQANGVFNAQASINGADHQAVKPVTNAERQLFANSTPSVLGN